MCHVIIVSGAPVRCPSWLPAKGWSLHKKGYVIYTSRKRQDLIRRGEYMHRVILRALGVELKSEDHVHHQDHRKTNNCPLNLLLCPSCMNPATALRHPWTGRFLSASEYSRLGLAA